VDLILIFYTYLNYVVQSTDIAIACYLAGIVYLFCLHACCSACCCYSCRVSVCLLQVHSGTRSPAVSDDGALQLQQHSGDVFSR